MSACIRSLYASDQRAPGFWFALLWGSGSGGARDCVSVVDFRAPAFSLSVARGVVEFEDEFELSMQSKYRLGLD
jgi:hypothetical protein